MRKQLVFLSLMLAGFFLNSCAAIPVMVAGSGTFACVAYEKVDDVIADGKERCPALVEIDEQLKNIDKRLRN